MSLGNFHLSKKQVPSDPHVSILTHIYFVVNSKKKYSTQGFGGFSFSLYCPDSKHFHLNHPECLFDPPEQWASTSGLAGFQREASFRFTAGRKQINTHEWSSGGWEARRDTQTVFAFTNRTHESDEDGLAGAFRERVLTRGVDLQTAGLALPWRSLSRRSSGGRVRDRPLRLTGYRSLCFSSVWGSGGAFFATGEGW